jgi:ferredoxin
VVVPLEINIDREACMGSGNCSFYAPDTFDLDDEMIAIVVDPAGDPEEKIRLAAEGCPTRAISLRET